MLKSRFDGTEKTDMDKALKLASKKNPVSQSVLNKVLLYAGSMGNMYMDMIDQLGLYGDRIELLFRSCGSDIDNFLDTVLTLYEKEVSQDRIIAMKLPEEFDILVKECR